MDLKTINCSTEQSNLKQLHSSNIEDQRNISSCYGLVAQNEMSRGSDVISTRDQAPFVREPSYVVPGQPISVFSEKASGLNRNASTQTESHLLSDVINIKTPGLVKRSQSVQFVGNSTQRSNEEASDILRTENIQNFFTKKTEFTGNFKRSFQVMFQLFEHYSRQTSSHPDQTANLFMTALHEPVQLFLHWNVLIGDTYERIRAMMFQEYSSAVRKYQVERHLQPIRLTHSAIPLSVSSLQFSSQFRQSRRWKWCLESQLDHLHSLPIWWTPLSDITHTIRAILVSSSCIRQIVVFL